jgi:hypothetical protein
MGTWADATGDVLVAVVDDEQRLLESNRGDFTTALLTRCDNDVTVSRCNVCGEGYRSRLHRELFDCCFNRHVTSSNFPFDS